LNGFAGEKKSSRPTLSLFMHSPVSVRRRTFLHAAYLHDGHHHYINDTHHQKATAKRKRSSMRVSKEQAAANREQIVHQAARLFRERGFDGIGVAELMKNAGLTHGGFYGHFDSKEQLMAEACEYAIGVTGRRWRRLVSDSDGPSMDTLARRYLSKRHRDAPGDGCVLAALAGDAARQSPPVRAAFTGSVKRFIDLLGNALPTRAKAARRQKAVAACAAMVGALVLSRAVDDPALSEEFLDAVAAQLPGTH
jgi:TetR/AcrR family transcriptional repressor of nem operon|tara:strand:- start:8972 stop:9724 length:753 start_codon:yes stop_codon:yes gene_type:complete